MGWHWAALEIWLSLEIWLGLAGDLVGLEICLDCRFGGVGLDILLGWGISWVEYSAGLDVWLGWKFG